MLIYFKEIDVYIFNNKRKILKLLSIISLRNLPSLHGNVSVMSIPVHSNTRAVTQQ